MKIFAKAKTGAKQEKVEKISQNHFLVWVKEPPEKGRANAAIVKALVRYLKIRRTEIKLIAGFRSKQKTLEIEA